MAYCYRKIISRNGLTLCCCLIAAISHAQTSNTPDTLLEKQKDVIGIAIDILNIKKKHTDSVRSNKKIQFSLLPSAGAAPGGGTDGRAGVRRLRP